MCVSVRGYIYILENDACGGQKKVPDLLELA